MKRILVYAGGHIFSGAEFITLNVLKMLRDEGYSLKILINGWADGAFANELTNNGFEFTKVKLGFIYLNRLDWTWDSIKNYPKAYSTLIKVFHSFNPDFVYCSSLRQIFLLYPFLNNRRVMVHIHDNSSSRIFRLIIKHLQNKITRYIAVSEYIRINLLENGASNNKISVIKNGIPIPEEVRKYKIDNQNAVSISILGQLNKNKGHHLLIEALGSPTLKSFKWKLNIFGGGSDEYKEQIQNQATLLNLQDDIVWHGFISDKRIIFEDTDIVVVPSLHNDPYPTSALEAAAYGCPVIASDMGGLPEIVADGATGFLFKANDASDLRSRLHILISNRELLHSFSINSRNLALESFDIDLQKRSIIKLFRENE